MADESIVPNEILCIIFEWTCAENLLQEYPWPLNSRHKPTTTLTSHAITYLPALAISAVCAQWRIVALASPKLWSQLRLETFLDEMGSGGGRFLSTLRLYLDRSADAPLMIDVETKGLVQIKCNSPALNFLLNYTHRWKSFSYTGDYNLERWIGFSHSFSILENLALIGTNNASVRTDFNCFKDAPNLRTFTAGDLISSLPWNHLTSLNVWARNVYLLRQHHDLTVLKLCSRWNSFGPRIILLPLLETFTFVEYTDRRENLLENMFSRFTFPSLTELVIYSEFTDSKLIWPTDVFSSFILRSTCILTTLSLSAITISDRHLIAALRLLPSLVNFAIDSLVNADSRSPITSRFISRMHASSRNPLLPKLCTLTLTIQDLQFDDTAFVDMISSRWLPTTSGSLTASAGIDCLRSLVLRFPHRKPGDLDEKAYSHLWHLDKMGMRVVTTTGWDLETQIIDGF